MLNNLGFNVFIDFEFIIKLVFIIVSSMLIGSNRGKQNQFAGLKTHLFVAIGAGLAFIVPELYITNNNLTSADPFRLSAQVISGIGFLGAGAIIKSGLNVRGLTTAASLWVTAVIAITFAAGMFFIGTVSTVIVFLFLTFNEKFDPAHKYSTENIIVTIIGSDDAILDIDTYMEANTKLTEKPSILEIINNENNNTAIVAYEFFNQRSKVSTNEIVKTLARRKDVFKVESVSEMDKSNWKNPNMY